jgi:hypothetical protein
MGISTPKPDGMMKPEQIWQAALGEMQLQLTTATYNTWLARARLMSFDGGMFTIGVHNKFAQEWLENRLDGMVKRALRSICGTTVDVKFVVLNGAVHESPQHVTDITETEAMDAEPDEVEPAHEFVLPELPDLKEVGYFPVSRYDNDFWAVLIGRVGFRVWQIVRSTDIRKAKTEWTPEHRWSVPGLARRVPCGPQSIIGVPSRGQPGALDRLKELRVGQVVRNGEQRDPHTRYILSVLVRLPLLTPEQVRMLPDELQSEHDRWLGDHGFDPRDWFVG